MWSRRLALGGCLIGVALGACLLNAHPEHQGFCARLAALSSMPLLIALSPILFLFSISGAGFVVHAVSAVLTWTLAGFAAGLAADSRKPRRVFGTKST